MLILLLNIMKKLYTVACIVLNIFGAIKLAASLKNKKNA